LIGEIRSQFPALQRTHNGHEVAYFDGPGGTQVPVHVVDAVRDYLVEHNANTHWNYPSSAETDEILQRSRETLADFVAGDPGEIAFGANMTTLTFHVARALSAAWKPGDVVVVTELDHHANVAPWRRLSRERGMEIRTVRMCADTGTLDEEDLARAITSGKPPRLVAIGAASNALGTINDIGAACEMARRVGALSFVDAVHYAPHVLCDAAATGCDFLACSAYKFYGPHVGVLWTRRELLDSLDVPKLDPAPDETGERLETGTQNHEGIAGAAAAVEFIASLGSGDSRRARLASAFGRLHERARSQVEQLLAGLQEIPGVTTYGVPADARRTPTVAFTVNGFDSEEVAGRLAERGVFVSHGDFYAQTVVERLGLEREGLVRAGCACYTSDDEVERLLAGVAAISGTGR
jgi:cysteine desulfurase family protein (TIGR01976 family)